MMPSKRRAPRLPYSYENRSALAECADRQDRASPIPANNAGSHGPSPYLVDRSGEHWQKVDADTARRLDTIERRLRRVGQLAARIDPVFDGLSIAAAVLGLALVVRSCWPHLAALAAQVPG